MSNFSSYFSVSTYFLNHIQIHFICVYTTYVQKIEVKCLTKAKSVLFSIVKQVIILPRFCVEEKTFNYKNMNKTTCFLEYRHS